MSEVEEATDDATDIFATDAVLVRDLRMGAPPSCWVETFPADEEEEDDGGDGGPVKADEMACSKRPVAVIQPR